MGGGSEKVKSAPTSLMVSCSEKVLQRLKDFDDPIGNCGTIAKTKTIPSVNRAKY